ncbi:MAG: DUF3520 domain-containing protein [bacterium]|nr:DUF3520 domain-containing protein [bacterium]
MRRIIFYDFFQKQSPSKIWKYFVGSFFIHCWVIAIVLVIPVTAVIANSPSPAAKNAGVHTPVLPENSPQSLPMEMSTAPDDDPYGLNEEFKGISDDFVEGDVGGDVGGDRHAASGNTNRPVSGNPVDLTGIGNDIVTADNPAASPALSRYLDKRTVDLTDRNITEPGLPANNYQHKVPRGVSDVIDKNESINLYKKPFSSPLEKPSSTFSLKVGTTSYPRVRRALRKKQMPPQEIVKIEEMINYFSYEYPQPKGEHPIGVFTEINACPWAPSHHLLHIGLQGKIVFGDGLKDSMYIIAKDVKINISFNPKRVKGYRLIGYANRRPKLVALKDVSKLSGELTAGQSVTSLYEIIPLEPSVDSPDNAAQELARVNVSYRVPLGVDKKIVSSGVPVPRSNDSPSGRFTFSAAVAQFGMLLKNPDGNHEFAFDEILTMAMEAMGEDRYGHRAQFIKILESYQEVKKNSAKPKNKPDNK